jgi:RNA polymerase sigma-70 factor (ECF subfamily)
MSEGRQIDHRAEMRELASLWVKAQPAIAAYLSAFVRDYHHLQDLLQEVAEAAATHFHKYDRQRSFLAWTLGIARRRVMRYYRTQHRERHVFSHEATKVIADAVERVEPELEARRAALKKCLDNLEGQRHRVLILRYELGYSPHEIAELLGLTSTAVRSMLHRIRRSLAACVSKQLALQRSG